MDDKYEIALSTAPTCGKGILGLGLACGDVEEGQVAQCDRCRLKMKYQFEFLDLYRSPSIRTDRLAGALEEVGKSEGLCNLISIELGEDVDEHRQKDYRVRDVLPSVAMTIRQNEAAARAIREAKGKVD